MEQQYIPSNYQHKDKQAAKLGQELEYINPKHHRYFCKLYKLQSTTNQITLLLKDMQDYHELISNQYKKITKFIHEYHVNNPFNSLLATALQYFDQFTIQNTRFITKIAKNHLSCQLENSSPKEQHILCKDCKGVLSNYRVKQIKQELELNKFEDKCNFYNVDNLNFTDLVNLRRESNHIIDSQLGVNENCLQVKGTCLSLQQYDEVLNLLGSDLYQKNTQIQKIIQYFNQTDRKFIEESTFKERESEEEMIYMQKIAQGKSVTQKLDYIIRLFFRKYNKAKASKRKDMEVQVKIKDNQVIKELEKEKKTIKSRIYQLTADKQRITAEYQNKIKILQLEISSNANEFKQKMGEKSLQLYELSKKYAQEYNLHEIHRKQLESVTNQYTNLMAVVNRNNNPNSREKSSRKKGEINKKSKSKGRVKNSIKRLSSNYADINDEDNEDLDNIGRVSSKNMYRSMENSPKGPFVENTQKEISKFATCQKIEEKHEQEQNGDNISKLILKKQASRFKALVNHFNSNSTIPNEDTKQKFERITINSASLQVIKGENKKNTAGQCTVLPQIRVFAQSSTKFYTQQRKDILYKLFQNERQAQQLKITFSNFMQLYNNFITKISSQKVLARSSSLSHSQTQQHFRQRVSILNQRNMLSTSSNLKSFEKSNSLISDKLSNEEAEGSRPRFESTKKSIKQNKSKVELLNKKSQYYFKKASQKSFHDFNTYSKTAENTLRNNGNLTNLNINLSTINSNSKLGQKEGFECKLFTTQQITQLFINQANMCSNKIVKDTMSKDQNQNLMNICTELAKIHLKNKNQYQEIKHVLSYPKQIINNQTVDHASNTAQIKTALRYILGLHRECKKQKGKNCLHICKLLSKLKQMSKQQ